MENQIDIFITKSLIINIIHFQDGSKELKTYTSIEKIEKNNSYNSVKVYFTDQNFTIVPEELFEAKKTADILKFSTSFNPEFEKEFHSNLMAFNSYILWSSNKKVIDYIAGIYPNTEFHHISEIGIQKLYRQKENNLTIEIGDLVLSGSKSKNQLKQISLNEGRALSDKVYFALLPFQNTEKDQLITYYIGSPSLKLEIKKFINISNFDEKEESNLLEIIENYQLRIIRGKYQGHRFNVPKNIKARPTTDFAKESLFNILNNDFDFEGLRVLDLFGGTGNISYEFGSRGASEIILIEKNFQHCKFIRKQLANWDLPIHVITGDVFKAISQLTGNFDIVFADPPYNLERISELPELILNQNIINEDGVLIIEHGRETDFSNHEKHIKTKTYSRVNFSFFKP